MPGPLTRQSYPRRPQARRASRVTCWIERRCKLGWRDFVAPDGRSADERGVKTVSLRQLPGHYASRHVDHATVICFYLPLLALTCHTTETLLQLDLPCCRLCLLLAILPRLYYLPYYLLPTMPLPMLLAILS